MPSVSTSMTCAPVRFQPVDHLLQKLAPDLRDARGRVEIGEVALRETEVAVEAVDQDLEGVLQRVEMLLLRAVRGGAHAGLRLETKSAQIGEEIAEDLQLVGDRESNRTAT